ncbi:MAG: alpha/beta hydrolase [Micromonosporaceae bacterium]|nr:alpha/beta hydrolase [Micromonosporaceae bacterium]
MPSARIRYREAGSGPPVVFVHGLLVNSLLWRAVAPAVADAGLHCIAPDWPLGAHHIPVPTADLSLTGIADLVAAFLDRLDLTDVTLVANDTGGAITQILMTRHPERIGRVVLTPSDAFERLLPPPFTLLATLGRLPGGGWQIGQVMRLQAVHRLPVAFGWVAKRPIPVEVVNAYMAPIQQNSLVRKDLRRFLRSANRRETLAAGAALRTFTKPVLLAWAQEDRVFPMALAERLRQAVPRASLVAIPDSYTFVPEDQPDRLADLVVAFTRTTVAP